MSGEEERIPRLLLIIGSLQGGGAERQIVDMANYWADHGAAVTLATWSGPEARDFYPLHPGVARLWLDVGVRRGVPFATLIASCQRVMRLRRLLRDSRPDAVVSFIDVSNLYTILASRGLGIRVVVAERTHPAINRTVGWPWRILRRALYSRADIVVAQTRDAADWIRRNCRTRVQVIPNALRAREQEPIERQPLIIAVGRLSREKGFDLLLQAFAQLAADFPDWRVALLGEGSERHTLERLRDSLGLAARVEFVGEVRNVESWMSRAALLVHPSRREGFPNVVMEAMGMGLPVICANCRAGPSDLIIDGLNGRLVAVDDLDALTDAMSALMSSPPARARLGAAALGVRQIYDQDAIMQRWRDCVAAPNARSSATRSIRARLQCRGARVGVSALRLLFRFDAWHASAPYSCRPYKKTVVGLANSLRPVLAVEVGCGLGDIVSRIRSPERFGIDTEARVVRAARFLHGRRGQWIHGDATCIPQVIPANRLIDCLIMVNWIHALSPAQLSGMLLPLLPRIRFLILDAIDADGPSSYRHRHDFAFLAGMTRRTMTARVPDEPRSFIVFEVLR